jgi:hypothetical protein
VRGGEDSFGLLSVSLKPNGLVYGLTSTYGSDLLIISSLLRFIALTTVISIRVGGPPAPPSLVRPLRPLRLLRPLRPPDAAEAEPEHRLTLSRSLRSLTRWLRLLVPTLAVRERERGADEARADDCTEANSACGWW